MAWYQSNWNQIKKFYISKIKLDVTPILIVLVRVHLKKCCIYC